MVDKLVLVVEDECVGCVGCGEGVGDVLGFVVEIWECLVVVVGFGDYLIGFVLWVGDDVVIGDIDYWDVLIGEVLVECG